MTQEVAWNDGTGDKIYLTYSASEGDQTISVSSDANTGAARSKTVTFSATGTSSVTLTVNQESGAPVIPTGYTRVQYLTLNGSGYFELDGACSEVTDAVEFDLQLSATTVQQRFAGNNGASYRFSLYVNGNGEWAYRQGSSWRTSGIAVDTNRHTVLYDFYNKVVKVDTTAVTMPGSGASGTVHCYFAGKYSNYPRFAGKIYGLKYWRNGTLIKNYIMLRDDNNSPYVYDLVAQAFVTIGGSGTTVGPDYE